MEWIADPNAWVALATLAALEIVLGVDNIIFISILVGRLPEPQRARARTLGLALAAGTRILLLLSITWVMAADRSAVHRLGLGVLGSQSILLGGGLFLLWKSVHEIHGSLEGEAEHTRRRGQRRIFFAVILQIAVIDIVFSLDSVITAVGLVDEVAIMIIAILLAVGVMIFAAGGEHVRRRYPTIKMLALSIPRADRRCADCGGLGLPHPQRLYLLPMAFAIAVEMLNMRVRKRMQEPLQLRRKGRGGGAPPKARASPPYGTEGNPWFPSVTRFRLKRRQTQSGRARAPARECHACLHRC